MILEGLEDSGVGVKGGYLPYSIERGQAGGLRVKAKGSSGQMEDTYDTVMMAVGRTSSIKGLGLETVGVEVDSRGKVKGL